MDALIDEKGCRLGDRKIDRMVLGMERDREAHPWLPEELLASCMKRKSTRDLSKA